MDANEIWKLVLGIAFVGLVFWWFYWRRGGKAGHREERKLQQVEMKLMNGKLEPAEITLKVNLPVQWLIHRYDSEPADEIFEIAELELYELLPAAHTTIMAFLPEKKGAFDIILGAEKKVGKVRVE